MALPHVPTAGSLCCRSCSLELTAGPNRSHSVAATRRPVTQLFHPGYPALWTVCINNLHIVFGPLHSSRLSGHGHSIHGGRDAAKHLGKDALHCAIAGCWLAGRFIKIKLTVDLDHHGIDRGVTGENPWHQSPSKWLIL